MNTTNSNVDHIITFGKSTRPIESVQYVAWRIMELGLHAEDRNWIQTLVLDILCYGSVNVTQIMAFMPLDRIEGRAFMRCLSFCHGYSLAMVTRDCNLTPLFWSLFRALCSSDVNQQPEEVCDFVWRSLASELSQELELPQLGALIGRALEDTYSLYKQGSREVFASLVREQVCLRVGFGAGQTSTPQGREEMATRVIKPARKADVDCEQQPAKRQRRRNILVDEEDEATEAEETCGFSLVDDCGSNPFEEEPVVFVQLPQVAAPSSVDVITLLRQALAALQAQEQAVTAGLPPRFAPVTTIHLPREVL
jgi:hypothetical protein